MPPSRLSIQSGAARDRADAGQFLISQDVYHKPFPSIEQPTRLRDYLLQEKLGEGGMGTVYRAVHSKLDRVVALKTLSAARTQDRESVARFHREMQAVGAVDHPNIVRATDAGEVDGVHFLVMEFVKGIDLSRLVKRSGPLPVGVACEVIRQAAAALQYAHEQGLVHRDVKPANLMIASSGRPGLVHC